MNSEARPEVALHIGVQFVLGMVPLFEQTPSGFDYLYNRRTALDPNDYVLDTSPTLLAVCGGGCDATTNANTMIASGVCSKR